MRYTDPRAQLRAARVQLGLSQAALAARAGTSRVTVARLEGGSAHDVRLGTVVRLSQALGLELRAVAAGEPALAAGLAREREKLRRLERRLGHAVLAARLLAARPAQARTLVARARVNVDRWERDRLCSSHYVRRWRTLLDGSVADLGHALLAPGDWGDALFQSSPFGFALERPAA